MSFISVRIDVPVWRHLKKYYEQEAWFRKRCVEDVYYITKKDRMGIVLLGLLELRPLKITRQKTNPLPVLRFDLGRHTETKIRSYLSEEKEEAFNKYLHKEFKRDAVMHVRILNAFGVPVEKALIHFLYSNGLTEDDIDPASLMQEFKRNKTALRSRSDSGLQPIFPKLYQKTAHGRLA